MSCKLCKTKLDPNGKCPKRRKALYQAILVTILGGILIAALPPVDAALISLGVLNSSPNIVTMLAFWVLGIMILIFGILGLCSLDTPYNSGTPHHV